jgi:hypothetical protein
MLIKLEVCAESIGNGTHRALKLHSATQRFNFNDGQTVRLSKLLDLVNIGGFSTMLRGIFLSTEARRNSARRELACGVSQIEAHLNNCFGINRANMTCACYRVSVAPWKFLASLMGWV